MKITNFLGAIGLILSISGCSEIPTQQPQNTSMSADLITDFNPYELKDNGIYSCSKEPITLTCFSHWQDKYILLDNMPIPNEMTTFTNVTLSGVANNYGNNSSLAFDNMIKEDVLPDIIGGEITDIIRNSQQSFLPLNDLIDEYAPNIKSALIKYPDAKATVTAEDGNIYCIPFISEEIVSQGWFIRQDWLDELGLTAPSTFYEFESILYAFRNNDLNKNGIADEIAFFRSKNTDDNKLTPLLQLFGINAFWHINENNQVQIGMYQQEYKEAIKYISKWYADGLISADIFTTDIENRDILYSQNNGGITFDEMSSTSTYNDITTSYVPDFYLSAMLPPADIDGDVWTAYSRSRTDGFGWGISVDNQDVVATIKFMDFLFSQKGRDITTYGIAGLTFDYDSNEKPVYSQYMYEDENSPIEKIYEMGGSISTMAYLQDSAYEYQIMSEEGKIGTELYKIYDVVNTKLLGLPTLNFTSEEEYFIKYKYNICLEYINQKTEQWIYDSSLIDFEFDIYMKTLSSLGMDDIINIYQNAYNRAK